MFTLGYTGKLKRLADQVIRLKPEFEKKSDSELKYCTEKFKERIQKGEKLSSLLPEAYAVVREASRRVTGMEPFPVQIMAGIALNEEKIAEAATGEGKTLVAAMPSYLNALTGKAVHVVTVNDYLAKRDADEIGQIHRFLGLSVGCVLNSMKPEERKKEYACDITYVTNNELGFDYLRDHMAPSRDLQVLRGLDYCIIDEADSVMIDEARTPLIISGQGKRSTRLYTAADHLARQLKEGEILSGTSKLDLLDGIVETGDFIREEKENQIRLTEQGIRKTEDFFQISNLSDPENLDIQHHVNLALRAHYMMKRDKDYVVKNNEVLIVDEFTGRTMPGRRYSDGLHQAIEAKERVPIQKENQTLASITFQNFFNLYEKKSGMTGTAKTEEKEFKKIYGMSVTVIPTHKPVIRKDEPDVVYQTKEEKRKAIVEAVKEAHERNQPVLLGTPTVEESEILSKLLKKEGLKHQVLNAKYIEWEAEIIKDSGKAGSITIATNMAGRGTDIKLDEEARKAGGLKVIGSERHESRRIDHQLRGRSGRQGDPGESQFYVSLEDDLMRLFGSERMQSIVKASGLKKDEPIQDKFLSKAIENSQKKVENNHLGIRERLYQYDQINSEQRKMIYTERDQILDQENCSDIVKDMLAFVVSEISKSEHPEKDGYLVCNRKPEDFAHPNLPEEIYQDWTKQFDSDTDREKIEKTILLRVIDQKWTQHVNNLEQLRESIGLQSYGRKNPLTEYKLEAYRMFEKMLKEIQFTVARMITHIKVEQPDKKT